MQITIQLYDSSDIELLLAFLQRIGAEVVRKTQDSPSVSAVQWLEALAHEEGVKSIPNPSEWQREIRQDKPLIFREL